MKQNRVISTAVLLLLLGAAIPALAQKGEEEKGGSGGKAQPAQHQAQPQQHAQKEQPQLRAQKAQPQQHAQKAQPQQRAQKAQPQQRAQKAQPQQRAQKAQPQQRAQQAQRQQPQRKQQAKQSGRQQGQAVASNSGGGHYGRISDTSYRAHFGHDHSFHMIRPRMIEGYNRFQYGGYWFGFNQEWPEGWSYDDTVYVEYIDGAYYLCDLRFPGVQITLNMF